MGVKKGTRLRGIRSLRDLKDRCYVDDVTGCWIWRLSSYGGAANVAMPDPATGKIKKYRGRRAALILAGVEVPKGMSALPKPECEHPLCCNPAHAFVGGYDDYGRVLRERGLFKNQPKRIAANRRNAQALRKLSPEQLEQVLTRLDISGVRFAAAFNVSQSTISAVRRRERYVDSVKCSSIFTWGR